MSVLTPWPRPTKHIWDAPRTEFLCPCGVGHPPHWKRDGVHGCCGCCSKPAFPGRRPLPGDLALCGAGTLGLITSRQKELVKYPDGNQAEAWTGVHLTNVMTGITEPWSSRNPCVLSVSIFDVLLINKKGRSLSMPHMHFEKYIPSGWPRRLEYVPPVTVKVFMQWFAPGNQELLAAQRKEEISARH